ncbi:transcription factor bHLH30-like [Magnolia sinica]|uniref:transcription factor bHLH30-like n=1 Tax=Magnolia sinica TaxID=86752 RepID=UPI00265B564E|nr:transcription factor bHLH30-like [Magnolia sinica]
MEKCIPSGRVQETHRTQFPSMYKGCLILPWPAHVTSPWFVRGTTSSSSMEESVEARAITTSSSHSQAEKRRRERINAHLSTLRHLIPSASKMDKASLLGAVIDHVKDLKRKAFELGQSLIMPTEVDEVTVECNENGNNKIKNKESIIIRVSFCCNDRPELFADLSQALDSLQLRTVRADIVTLGGRVRNVLILSAKDSEEIVCLSSLKDSLKAVLGWVALPRMSSPGTSTNKKQCVSNPFT